MIYLFREELSKWILPEERKRKRAYLIRAKGIYIRQQAQRPCDTDYKGGNRVAPEEQTTTA